ncbi:hypothetical protein [Pararhodobacter sp.]|uniref:hypothetical protein n=1 Tax=Pararhodobacter sp. TaxID=2127056 RepID=UPI002FE017FE
MIRASLFAVFLIPGAALAQPILIQSECWGPALARQEASQGEYNPLVYPGGLVFYERTGDPWGVEVVIEHCPSRDRVAATLYPVPEAERVDPAEARALADAFLNALDSAETYTFGDLARMAAGLGANVVQTRVAYQSCACRIAEGR